MCVCVTRNSLMMNVKDSKRRVNWVICKNIPACDLLKNVSALCKWVGTLRISLRK